VIRWLLALALVACTGAPDAPTTHDATTAPATVMWTCGMHPQVVQDKPGSCPICGMDLVPMGTVAPAGDGPTVYVDGSVRQAMNLRTGVVERQPLFRHLRTVGQVEVGEDQVSVVNLRFGGWVERIHVDKTGDAVKKGDPLFDIYSPDLVATQEEFVLAMRSEGPDSSHARSARRKLELSGVAEQDIARLERTGETTKTLPVRAPATGFVLSKDVVEGASVEMGRDLYRIGNLDRIWVTAEVYEFDAPWVEVGQPAQMELAFQAGKLHEGTVSYIYPTLNPTTRTLTVRLEFENPGVRLKPGMFATVYIQYRRIDDVLAVPSEAILHSGRREIVFVDLGDGHFEPREITTGLQGDHHMSEVTSGLVEGERVVVSGQFLLDSESNLQEAVQKLVAQRAGVETAATPEAALYACPMHPHIQSHEPGRCSECGMFLEKLEPAGTPE